MGVHKQACQPRAMLAWRSAASRARTASSHQPRFPAPNRAGRAPAVRSSAPPSASSSSPRWKPQRQVPTRDDADHAPGFHLKCRRALRSIEHPEPSRRPRANVHQPPARHEPFASARDTNASSAGARPSIARTTSRSSRRIRSMHSRTLSR